MAETKAKAKAKVSTKKKPTTKAVTKTTTKRTKATVSKTAKKVSKRLSPPVPKNLIAQTLDKFSSHCLYVYGSYVVEDRAVPDFRDGLKPVHRAILWSMYELGLHKPNTKHKKSARVVGDALGKYHPHGDTACYGAAVTLANTNVKLIDGQGNWGTPVDGAAAMRYTEARLDKFAATFMLDSRYLAVVPRDPNYDGTETIPRYLPSLLPTLLLIGSARAPAFGVSVGNPAFEIEGVAKLIDKGLSGKNITTADCIRYLKPEYPSGCENITKDLDYEKFVETGKGSLVVRAIIEPKWDKKKILVNCYAPSFNSVVSVQKKMDTIANMSGVSTVVSASKDNPDAILEVRAARGISEDAFFTLAEKLEKLLTAKDPFELGFVFKRTEEETTFHKMGYAKFLNNWCVYRKKLEADFLAHCILLEEKKLSRLELLVFAVNNREIIIKALDNKDPDAFLIKKLKQPAEYIKMLLDLQVRKLAKLELKSLKADIQDVKDSIKKLKTSAKDSGKSAAVETKRLVKNFLKTK